MESPRLEQLPLAQLATICSQQSGLFRKGMPSCDCYCLELFRRAIALRDEGAWACLYQQYRPLVLAWLAQRRGAAPLLVQDGPDPLVNAAFARFARAMTPAKLEASTSLAALLEYLKRCARSAVTDALRARLTRPHEEALDEGEHDRQTVDTSEGVVDRLAAQGLWQVISEVLPGEDERVLLYCSVLLGMKPSEIAAQYPARFSTAAEVSRIRRNALDRLRRNPRLRSRSWLR